MKKIIIVNNNMKIGGVQKSLYNLLWSVADDYDITLCLFSRTGEYIDKLPSNVRVVACRSLFRYLGVGQSECGRSPRDCLTRGLLALVCRLFGRKAVMRLLLRSQKPIEEHYDCAISFLHNGSLRHFYGGVNEFVLAKTDAARKIAFLHCDYAHCGANCEENNALYKGFDAIAACSNGCREAFLRVMPELRDKCVTVSNFHRYDEIRRLANNEPFTYSLDALNVVMVGRLAHEKGVDRAVRAVKFACDEGIPVKLHLVGSGPMEPELRKTVAELPLEDHVVFHGAQSNPYRFMRNADLLLLASYHEAAPMVIDEACCLGLPILTVQTTSSDEMVTVRRCGWVCENSQEALNEALVSVLKNASGIEAVKERLKDGSITNDAASASFRMLIEGRHD